MNTDKLWLYVIALCLSYLGFNPIHIYATVVRLPELEEKLLREFVHHEVTQPTVLHRQHQVSTTKTKRGHLPSITVTFSAYNMTFVIDLQINRQLFSSTYIEKHFAADGSPVINNNTLHHDSHCYYQGRLRGDPLSLVAISTCHGVRGSIFSSSGVYHIEPTESVINGRHFVFNDIHQRPKPLLCGHKHEIFTGFHNKRKPQRLKRAVVGDWPYDYTGDTRVVEMYIVNDNTEFKEHGRNLMKVISRTKEIINLVSSLYRPIDVYIALVGIEVWTVEDKIEVVENPDNTMNNFLTYRREEITVRHPNDNAQLITGQTLGSGVVGKAPIMTICSWQYSGGVNMDHNMVVGPVATTVAHELGHNFGLSHDTDTCGCPDDRCIMAASSGGINNPTKWSQCSVRQFSDAFAQGMDYCLKNLPEGTFGAATCGNGFLEEGEECDCGLLQDCNTACCDPFTCKLTENATCATGSCCDLETCKPKQAATLCRPATNDCDLPETCNGKDEFCPPNTYYVNGQPCANEHGDSYCYQGQCRSRESQCQKLWGRTGHDSVTACYTHFNTMGQANGHCGFSWVDKLFTACQPKDVMCGMLHCTHLNEKLMFWKEALAYTMPEGSVIVNNARQECKGAILDVGLDMPDPGMVPDGAKCGEGKLCIAQSCTPVESLNVLSCPDCHGHGYCNNFGECHCEKGYAPPKCDTIGSGGSLSSGPLEVNNKNVGLILGLCVLFLIILPLLAVAGYFGYKHREHLKKLILQGPTEGYRKRMESSIYRAKPRHDTVNHADKSAPTPSIVSVPVPVPVTRNASNASKPLNTSTGSVRAPNHHRASALKRAYSFSPEDISNPQLESSTKSLTGIPTLRHSVGAVLGANVTAHGYPNKPCRPAPAPPPQSPEDGADHWSKESRVRSPHRPPPPREGFRPKRSSSPRANYPLPPTPDVKRTGNTRPETLGLKGGSSDSRYQNVDEEGPVSFSDVSLTSPGDYQTSSPSPAGQVSTFVNNRSQNNHAYYTNNKYKPSENSSEGKNNDTNGVNQRKKLFESNGDPRTPKPPPGSNPPVPGSRAKYSAAGPVSRTKSAGAGPRPVPGVRRNMSESVRPGNKPVVPANKPALPRKKQFKPTIANGEPTGPPPPYPGNITSDSQC